jgi:hypothetical protein
MRRKALQGVANTLCHLVDGDGRYRDDDHLARLGGGLVVIDALSGEATHDGRPIAPPLFVAERMQRWLTAALARLGLPPGAVVRAQVEVPYTVEAVVHDGMQLWELGFTCRSEVATDAVVYIGSPLPGRPAFGSSVQR